MALVHSYILVLWFFGYNILRRKIWNRRYKRHRDRTIKLFLTDFREFLNKTPSQAMGHSKEEGKSTGFTLAPITVDGYMRIVSKIVRDQGTVFPKKRQMFRHISYLKEKRASYSHICGSASCLEWLSRFWRSPIKIARPRKPERRVREVLSEQEIKTLIEACRTKRESGIMALSAWSGLRTKELTRVRVRDLDLKNLVVNVVCGKYFRDGSSCITQECADILADYINSANKKPDDFLFGQCTGSLRRTMARIKKRTDVITPVSPQRLRRSLATNLARRGADISTVSAQLRHKDQKTTLAHYVKHGPEMHRQAFDRYVPIYQDSQMDRHIEKFITGEFTFGADPLNVEASHFKPEMNHLLSVQHQLRAYAEALSQRVAQAARLPAKPADEAPLPPVQIRRRKSAAAKGDIVDGEIVKEKTPKAKRTAKEPRRRGATAKDKAPAQAKRRGRPKRDKSMLTANQQLILKQLKQCAAPLTNRFYRECANVSRHIANNDIIALCSLGFLQRDPTKAGRSICYLLTDMGMAMA